MVGALASVGAPACASDHRVSPWGGPASPTLAPFLAPADLGPKLAGFEAEARASGLRQSVEIEGRLGAGANAARLVIRGYEGKDAAGRPIHAVRVASARAVVMAVGPLDARDVDRRAATELVPALVGGAGKGAAAFRSGTDLNGDGAPDVVLRNDAGELTVYRLGELGSVAYEIAMAVAPTRGMSVEGEVSIGLAGELPVGAGDPIAPVLVDVATFAEGRYSSATPGGRGYHAAQAALLAKPPKAGEPRAREEVRLRRVLERAWHTMLAGEPAEPVMEALRKEAVPAELAGAFARHVFAIDGVARRLVPAPAPARQKADPKPKGP